jgi:cytidine deaminase
MRDDHQPSHENGPTLVPDAPAGADFDDLFAAATEARAQAYAPYSGYPVGAALRADDGRVFAGCNVENAAYPVGTCAEAGAISAMAAAGGRHIAAILVLAGGPELVSPCGACRQRIREFGTDDTPVHLVGLSGTGQTLRLGDLLPHSFGPGNLNRPPSQT